MKSTGDSEEFTFQSAHRIARTSQTISSLFQHLNSQPLWDTERYIVEEYSTYERESVWDRNTSEPRGKGQNERDETQTEWDEKDEAMMRLNQQPPRQIFEARRGDHFDPTWSLSFTKTSDPQKHAESSRRFEKVECD